MLVAKQGYYGWCCLEQQTAKTGCAATSSSVYHGGLVKCKNVAHHVWVSSHMFCSQAVNNETSKLELHHTSINT